MATPGRPLTTPTSSWRRDAGTIPMVFSGYLYLAMEKPGQQPPLDHYRLHTACYDGDIETVKSLLAGGNDPNVTYSKRSYLHTACWRGYTPIVRLLLEYGAHVDGSGLPGGYTPLHVACRYGQVEIVEILLKAGADGSRVDGRGMAPLGYIEDIRDVKGSERAAIRDAIVEVFREHCPEALFEVYCTRSMDR